MSGLIKRYHPSDEFAALMATKPSRRFDEDDADIGIELPNNSAAPDNRDGFHDIISKEAAEWGEAICPPVTDVQAMLRRIQSDPNLTQRNVFNSIYPLFVFTALFVLAAILLQTSFFAHHVIAEPIKHGRELAFGVVLVIAGLLAGLAILRFAIWCGALLVDWIITSETIKGRRGSKTRNQHVPQSGELLKNVFM